MVPLRMLLNGATRHTSIDLSSQEAQSPSKASSRPRRHPLLRKPSSSMFEFSSHLAEVAVAEEDENEVEKTTSATASPDLSAKTTATTASAASLSNKAVMASTTSEDAIQVAQQPAQAPAAHANRKGPLARRLSKALSMIEDGGRGGAASGRRSSTSPSLLAAKAAAAAATSSSGSKPSLSSEATKKEESNLVVNSKKDLETVSLQRSTEFVKLNVGGYEFLTRRRNFACFPLSRLGRLMRTKEEKRILELCDAYDEGLGDETLGQKRKIPLYFFDRNGRHFDQVLDLYRRGTLHACGESSGRCTMTSYQDLEYWGIDEYIFEACCSIKYHQGKENCTREIESAAREEKRMEEAADEDSFGHSRVERVRRAAWNLLEYPASSTAAKVFAVVSFAVILVSTFTFLVGAFLDDEAAGDGDGDDAREGSEDGEGTSLGRVLAVIDNCALAFFTLEYLTRLASAPSFFRFLFSLEGLPDLLAILPFLLSILVYELQAFNIVGKASKLLHLIRIVKVFRVFKLIRHLASLQSLLVTLKQANREIWLLGLMASIALLMFATITYYAEKNAGHQRFGFNDSLWYSVMTLTAVGFTGRQPMSWLGRLSAGVSAIFGAFVMTLPIPVVINSFAGYYRNRLIRRVMATKRARRLGERRRALRYQAIGVFLEEDNAVGAMAAMHFGSGGGAGGGMANPRKSRTSCTAHHAVPL